MFKHLIPLNAATHRDVRFAPDLNPQTVAALMTCPIVASEAAMACREYPIVFPKANNALPMVLLGVEQGHNRYLDGTGRWISRYIPAHIRRYPFMLAEPKKAATNGAEKSLIVMVDKQAVSESTNKGLRLFNDDGTPNDTLRKVESTLLNLHRDSLRTMAMVNAIDAAGLLVERVLKVKEKHATKPFGLSGMRIIDTAKLRECSPETLHSLARSGALLLIYTHIISQANLIDGPLIERERATSTVGTSHFSDIIAFNFDNH